MNAVKLTRGFSVSNEPDLDAHTDSVMDELVALEDECIRDADISVNFESREVEISIVVIGDDFDEAAAKADATIRTAIHAAGGHTPEWRDVMFTPTKSEADLVAV
jgi:hypothetical protein